MGGEEFNVTIGKENYLLIGQLIPVFPVLKPYDKIFVFNKAKKLKSDVYNLTNPHEILNCNIIIGESQAVKNIKEKIKKENRDEKFTFYFSDDNYFIGGDFGERAICR